MNRPFIICCILVFFQLPSIAQKIEINTRNSPLNTVLYELIEQYKLQVSFNDRQLARISISLNESFPNPEEALSRLLRDTDFTYRKEGNILIILKNRRIKFYIKGWVGDKLTGEALPFVHVLINEHGLITDLNGLFSMECEDEEQTIRVSYLGYYLLDSILTAGSHKLFLIPSIHDLQEITIEGKAVERSIEIGDDPGKIRLNQKTAHRLPGNGDNAVFNFLRLQPGILAAGEQSSDLIIWGGYEGHSKVMFDGFTIYGLKNFNDNISAVNPYMAKDILVLKGGYGAEFGGRVGGIVDITGISGDQKAPNVNLNINNMTMNGMASISIQSTSALTMAFRRTYYNLYTPDDINLPLTLNTRKVSDISIVPDYTFGDFNLKYSGSTPSLGSYYLSYYHGADDFGYNLDQERQFIKVRQNVNEANKQRGAAVQWSNSISKTLRSDLTASYSYLASDVSLVQDISRIFNAESVFTRASASGNSVSEIGLLNRYYLTFVNNSVHEIQGGFAYDYTIIQLETLEDKELKINSFGESGRFTAYITDNIGIGRIISIKPGIRLEMPGNIGKVYAQPRISLKITPLKNVNAYLAWGLYNQFISKTSVLDDYGNYQFFWAITDNIDVPVLSSIHYVTGLSYNTGIFTASAEGYYRTTNGLTRYVELLRQNTISVFSGDSKTYGGDFLLKGRLKKHEAWVSYSLSKTLEYFTYFPQDTYRYAPHDQRHEIKTSVLLNFKPAYLSANYVYGSGFILKNTLNAGIEAERYPYSRFDISFTYNISVKDYTFEIGASVLNLFNTENIKYSNFVRVPTEQISSINIHAEAVPFTPAIFLNIAF